MITKIQAEVIRFVTKHSASNAAGSEILGIINNAMMTLQQGECPIDYRKTVGRIEKMAPTMPSSINMSIDIAKLHWTLKKVPPVIAR